MTKLERVLDFFETDTFSITFSPRGLKYLSLRSDLGERRVNLRALQERDPQVREIIEESYKFLETGRHDLPLDLSDFTGFQQSVFAAVSGVEPGTVTTYKGIAEILGKPGGAQAVGSAVAKNPVSYFLPTHRVLPQRGIGICRTGAGHLREKLLAHEGHDLAKLRGNYICTRKKCCME